MTTSYNFHFRSSTRAGKNKGSLFLRVIHDRKSFAVSLGIHLFTEEWDPATRNIIVPRQSSPRYTALKAARESIDSMSLQIERIIADLDANGYYTVDDIRTQLRRRKDSGMLSDFVAAVMEEISERQLRTARAYKSMLVSVRKFNKGEEIKLSHINSRLVKAYESFLMDKGLKMNTVSFYIRNLRAVYNRAVRTGLVAYKFENPFSGVFTGVKQTEKKAIDASGIGGLIKLDTSLVDFSFDRGRSPLSKSNRDALALFLFAFYSQGMSFVDVAYLKKENITGGVIKYRRKKTGQDIGVSLCREMKSIIAYFAPRMKYSQYLFPIITSSVKCDRLQYESALRVQNIRLKKLGALSGQHNTISTHAARHSWATIAKNEKVELSVISEALGHHNENTTRIYLDTFGKKILDKANEKIRRAIKKAV